MLNKVSWGALFSKSYFEYLGQFGTTRVLKFLVKYFLDGTPSYLIDFRKSELSKTFLQKTFSLYEL